MNRIKIVILFLTTFYLPSQALLKELVVDTIVKHVQLMQDIKQAFATTQKTNTFTPIAHGKSQTEAYLAIHGDTIRGQWSKELAQYKDIIHTAIQREKEFSGTHFVVYHAQQHEWMIVQECIKHLITLLDIQPMQSDFIYLRNKTIKQLINYANAQEYVNDNNPRINDHDERDKLLSTNLSLFGNHNNSGECTFDYFINNMSVHTAHNHLQRALTVLFNDYNLDKKHVQSLIDVSTLLSGTTGNLIQIFIPKKLINQVAYLARAWGHPYPYEIVEKYFDKEKQRHHKITPILKQYQCDPKQNKKLEETIDEIQARLLFIEPMLNPQSGIKMFRYNTVSEKKMKQAESQVKDIMTQAITDSLAINSQTRSESMYKLIRYMNS